MSEIEKFYDDIRLVVSGNPQEKKIESQIWIPSLKNTYDSSSPYLLGKKVAGITNLIPMGKIYLNYESEMVGLESTKFQALSIPSLE